MKRFKLPKFKVRPGYLLITLFASYYLVGLLLFIAVGNWWSALSYFVFLLAIATYGWTVHIMRKQSALIDKMLEDQKKFIMEMSEHNQKLYDALLASNRKNTIEQFEVGRRATWS